MRRSSIELQPVIGSPGPGWVPLGIGLRSDQFAGEGAKAGLFFFQIAQQGFQLCQRNGIGPGIGGFQQCGALEGRSVCLAGACQYFGGASCVTAAFIKGLGQKVCRQRRQARFLAHQFAEAGFGIGIVAVCQLRCCLFEGFRPFGADFSEVRMKHEFIQGDRTDQERCPAIDKEAIALPDGLDLVLAKAFVDFFKNVAQGAAPVGVPNSGGNLDVAAAGCNVPALFWSRFSQAVGFSFSGEFAGPDVVGIGFHGGFRLGAQVGVAADEFWRPVEQAQQVLRNQDLPVAGS